MADLLVRHWFLWDLSPGTLLQVVRDWGWTDHVGENTRNSRGRSARYKPSGRGLPVESRTCKAGFEVKSCFARAVAGGTLSEAQPMGMVRVHVCNAFLSERS